MKNTDTPSSDDKSEQKQSIKLISKFGFQPSYRRQVYSNLRDQVFSAMVNFSNKFPSTMKHVIQRIVPSTSDNNRNRQISTNQSPDSKQKKTQVAKRTRINNRITDPIVADKKNIAYILPIGPITNIYEKIYDCCCFLIHCVNHEKICVLKSPLSPFIWIPFVAQSQKCCWTKTAQDNLAWILANDSASQYEFLKHNPPYDQLQLIEILRLQLPQTGRFIIRLAFYVQLNVAAKDNKFSCCTTTDRLGWLDTDYIQEGLLENLWGPELVEFYPKIINNQYSIGQRINEFGSNQVFHYNPTTDSPKNLEETLLKSIKITENDVERLYYDFLEHCYPSYYMTFDSFHQYMLRNGIDLLNFNVERLFKAFNYKKNGFLCFHELLLGFVTMEQDTPHDELRIKFVFRYYDSKQQGLLYEEDIKKLVKDLIIATAESRKQEIPSMVDNELLNQRVKETMELFQAQPGRSGVRGKQTVNWKRFLTVIAAHEFRGTSLLCRSKKSIFDHIAKQIIRNSNKSTQQKYFLSPIVNKKYYSGICQSCKAKKYKLVPFRMVINQDGYYEKSETIKISKDDYNVKWDTETHFPYESSRRIHFLQPEHPANFFLRKIREFNQIKHTLKGGFMAKPNEREQLFLMFQQLFDELEPMLRAEPRVKPVYSPCFIIGDIHGNLEDLMSLETTIWKQFPCTGVHYLFLGDYVDRGRWSIECALYLFSIKALMPKMVTLLRGNHEIREIQAKYTYKRELFIKYEQIYGQRFWDLTNRLFDRLPLCAIIDDTIYCAHGGIPYQVTRLNDLERTIPQVILNPEHECPVAWEIMWSDPINKEHFQAIMNLYQIKGGNLKEGYIHNTKRGTAYYFNEKAVENFFLENHLTHLVRAHEVPKLGFMIHFEQKCVTIFSCSHYCGNDNECCVLLVNQNKIRIIRIDTSANLSATDNFQQTT